MADGFPIGKLSRRSGVSQSALRFYERQGLIAAERTDGNQRRYPGVTLRRVALIQAGKLDSGTLTPDVRGILHLPSYGAFPTPWDRL